MRGRGLRVRYKGECRETGLKTVYRSDSTFPRTFKSDKPVRLYMDRFFTLRQYFPLLLLTYKSPVEIRDGISSTRDSILTRSAPNMIRQQLTPENRDTTPKEKIPVFASKSVNEDLLGPLI